MKYLAWIPCVTSKNLLIRYSSYLAYVTLVRASDVV